MALHILDWCPFDSSILLVMRVTTACIAGRRNCVQLKYTLLPYITPPPPQPTNPLLLTPPPPQTHKLSLTGSITINAKTTVHCSPDSSMVRTIWDASVTRLLSGDKGGGWGGGCGGDDTAMSDCEPPGWLVEFRIPNFGSPTE
jgi:hypothetical protein